MEDMGLYSDGADWVAGQLFANVSMYFVAFLTLNTDTDIDTGAGEVCCHLPFQTLLQPGRMANP